MKPLSLTTRLTALFTISAIVVLVAFGSLTMISTSQHFIESDTEKLKISLTLIKEAIEQSKSFVDLKNRLDETAAHHPDWVLLLQNSNGERLYLSNEIRIPKEALIFLTHSNQEENKILEWKKNRQGFVGINKKASLNYSLDQNNLNSMIIKKSSDQASEIKDENTLNKSSGKLLDKLYKKSSSTLNQKSELRIFSIINTDHHLEFMRALFKNLVFSALIACIISTLFGWFAARKGLKPLLIMKQSTAQVTAAKHLDLRIPLETIPIEMKDLAQTLNNMLERLEKDFQKLSAFSSDLAHELRTPINNLMTQTQVTLSQPRDNKTYKDSLASNAEDFQRLAKVISDMLFLAKTENDLDLPTQEHFSLSKEVSTLFDFYEALAEEKKISLKQEGDGFIQGNVSMIRRALCNLLSNALRHAFDNSEILVQISSSPKEVEMTIENTGEVIEAHLLPRLFDRFFRADSSRLNLNSDRTGLGLAITQAIIKSHQGTITVTSEKGQTRFSMKFPSIKRFKS